MNVEEVQQPSNEVVEETPVVVTDEVLPAIEEEVKPVEEIVVPAPATEKAKVAEVKQTSNFAVAVVQRDEDGKIATQMQISFSLPKEDEFSANLILGTALDSLFTEMDLHKAVGSKLFSAKLPIELAVKSEHVSIDLGKFSKSVLSKFKINNGERSKLLFIDRFIALVNTALRPMNVKGLVELREDMANATQERYELENKPKGLISMSGLNKINKATLPKVEVNEDALVLN